ncbi:uncharacterized protein LOC134256767 [Saccostrea cucullata]|uniref:uncharacterized protein LOC134256767 n=1 Tax=Saccostrea cuccullata TaxID=36930 RepID=UPI002ED44D2E
MQVGIFILVLFLIPLVSSLVIQGPESSQTLPAGTQRATLKTNLGESSINPIAGFGASSFGTPQGSLGTQGFSNGFVTGSNSPFPPGFSGFPSGRDNFGPFSGSFSGPVSVGTPRSNTGRSPSSVSSRFTNLPVGSNPLDPFLGISPINTGRSVSPIRPRTGNIPVGTRRIGPVSPIHMFPGFIGSHRQDVSVGSNRHSTPHNPHHHDVPATSHTHDPHHTDVIVKDHHGHDVPVNPHHTDVHVKTDHHHHHEVKAVHVTTKNHRGETVHVNPHHGDVHVSKNNHHHDVPVNPHHVDVHVSKDNHHHDVPVNPHHVDVHVSKGNHHHDVPVNPHHVDVHVTKDHHHHHDVPVNPHHGDVPVSSHGPHAGDVHVDDFNIYSPRHKIGDLVPINHHGPHPPPPPALNGPECQFSGCTIGQECVIAKTMITRSATLCPRAYSGRCVCVPGCIHDQKFIPHAYLKYEGKCKYCKCFPDGRVECKRSRACMAKVEDQRIHRRIRKTQRRNRPRINLGGILNRFMETLFGKK